MTHTHFAPRSLRTRRFSAKWKIRSKYSWYSAGRAMRCRFRSLSSRAAQTRADARRRAQTRGAVGVAWGAQTSVEPHDTYLDLPWALFYGIFSTTGRSWYALVWLAKWGGETSEPHGCGSKARNYPQCKHPIQSNH